MIDPVQVEHRGNVLYCYREGALVYEITDAQIEAAQPPNLPQPDDVVYAVLAFTRARRENQRAHEVALDPIRRIGAALQLPRAAVLEMTHGLNDRGLHDMAGELERIGMPDITE